MFKRSIEAARKGEPIPRNDRETGHSIIKFKAFSTPFKAKPTTGSRKRARVDYSKMGGGSDGNGDGDAELDDGDSDVENKPSKKKSKKTKLVELGTFKNVNAYGASTNGPLPKFEFYKPKKDRIKEKFHIPSITDKDGQRILHQMSNAILGNRQIVDIPPRPLHDPMGEHAIILFDPTTDDLEAEREKARLQKEQEEMEKVMASQEAGVVAAAPIKKEIPIVRGPHKSLAAILNIKDRRKAAMEEPKVAVVIDPALAKVLRPHQVEGVKVSVKQRG